MNKKRKQQRAQNKATRIAAQKTKTNRVSKNLSGPERWAVVDAILDNKGTKTETQKAKTWQQVLSTGDKESVIVDKHGNKQTKIKSTYNIRKKEYRTLYKSQ
jgi:hypothetical protein